MTQNQQKGFFSGAGGNKGYNGMGTVAGTSGSGGVVVAEIFLWLCWQVVRVSGKLIVLIKYQFFKQTGIAPSTVQVPWIKFGVLSLFLFMATREDLSLFIGLEQSKHVRFGSTGLAEEIALKDKTGRNGVFGFFEEKKVDHFADVPGDNAKDRKIKSYVRRFKDVALAEKERYGIPASIKMAQAIVESNSGGSKLAVQNNNHFGVKCFSKTCSKGHCSNFGDDSHKDFFRRYDTAWESWRAHSEILANGRYSSLLKHGDDYRKWAKGLKKLGYATAGHYEETLINMIEKYHLYTLDE